MTVVGFTGSRKQPTAKQAKWLIDRMQELQPERLHHGACRGSDLLSHRIARILDVPVTIHPSNLASNLCSDPDWAMMFADDPGVTILPAKPPVERDHDIVDASELLLATPDGPERRRSGTWTTIRYLMRTKKRVEICYPDGDIKPIDMSDIWANSTQGVLFPVP